MIIDKLDIEYCTTNEDCKLCVCSYIEKVGLSNRWVCVKGYDIDGKFMKCGLPAGAWYTSQLEVYYT